VHSPSAPTLATERLTLRGHTLDDFADSMALWTDPAITRFIGGRPSTEEECWARLMRYLGHWALVGYGYWAIYETATGRFVGEAGFADFKREIEPSFERAPEGGWALAPWAHGKGYAFEALAAMTAWREAAFGPTRLVCMINPENGPSLKLAQRLDFKPYAQTIYKDAEVVLLERL
jgi:RimJ/RimL family protein N-acetyltransferase